MKTKYIIGIIAGIVFLTIAIFSFDSSKIEYANIAKAKEIGKTVQIMGSWVKDKPAEYNHEKDQFTFWMNDQDKKITKVIFDGSRPNNFDIATSIVVKGKYNGEYFHAKEILTKCPSKYEGGGQHPKDLKIENQKS